MFTVADMNQMAASQCGGYKRPERAEERTMRNELTQLTQQIDEYNADMDRVMTALGRLMSRQEQIIKDGTRMGLKKTNMIKMLACVKVRFAGPGSAIETPLADVLQEFDPADDHGRTVEQIAKDDANLAATHPVATPSAPGTDWRDDTIPEAIRPPAEPTGYIGETAEHKAKYGLRADDTFDLTKVSE